MSGAAAKRVAICAIYAQVQAPEWAAANLDGLVDVLRDLSWLPAGPVTVVLPDLAELPSEDRAAMLSALATAVSESGGSAHPVLLGDAAD